MKQGTSNNSFKIQKVSPKIKELFEMSRSKKIQHLRYSSDIFDRMLFCDGKIYALGLNWRTQLLQGGLWGFDNLTHTGRHYDIRPIDLVVAQTGFLRRRRCIRRCSSLSDVCGRASLLTSLLCSSSTGRIIAL